MGAVRRTGRGRGSWQEGPADMDTAPEGYCGMADDPRGLTVEAPDVHVNVEHKSFNSIL